MRKVCIIITGIFLTFLFTACKQFNANMEEYLSYWSAEVSPAYYHIDNLEKPYPTNKDSVLCIPSTNDVAVTIKLNNPKNFKFVMPDSSSADAGKVIRFSELSPPPECGIDYTLIQPANDKLTLTYKKAFLQKHEWGNGSISPAITFIAADGRVFRKKFSLNLKVDTAPILEHRGLGKTQVGSEWYYVLLFRVKDMGEMIGTESLHKDITNLIVTASDSSFSDIPLSVTGTQFTSSSTELLPATAVYHLTSGSLITSEIGLICFKTDVKVGGPKKTYSVIVKDRQGLSSAFIEASTETNKLPDVKLLDGVTPITGTTESAPFSFPGLDGKTLTATAHSGAGITGAIYKHDGSSWNEIRTVSGTTPVTVNLPALDSSENEAFYKITLKASLTGYADSDKKTFFVKLLRQELPVLTLKQDFSSSGQSFQKNISAETAGYVSEDIIPNAGSYNTATTPLIIYNLNGGAAFVIAPRTGSGATVKYQLNTDPEQSAPTEAPIILPNAPATHTLQVWAVKNGVEGPKTTLHIKVIKAITAYSELKNVVQNAPAGNEIRINIANDITAPADIGNTEIAVTGGKKLIALPKPGDPRHTINAGGRGRIFNISGSGTELTLEDIRLEGGNASTGGAAYVEAGGILGLTGRTLVTPSTGSEVNTAGKNDVYLANGAKIRVNSSLTSLDPIVARITPADHVEDREVLTGTAVSSDHTKFTVTQPADSTSSIWTIKSDGTLKKEALIIKNTDPNPWKKLQDFVRLTGEGSTITIDGEIKATNAPGNSGEIVIDKNLTIKKADGAASAVLDANKDTDGKPKHRIFKVEGGKTLTLTNLTLKGGKPDGLDEEGCGGGILVKGSTLNMTDCAVTGNTAENGGGIYAKKVGSTASAVTITGSMIGGTETTDANEATGYNGGGIYIEEDCSLTMRENVKITGNKAGASGGGIYTGANCALTMDRCTVTSNTAGNEGGGIYAQGTLTLTRCTVSDNTANSVGGGAYLAGTVNIKGASTIAHNAADESGGGIYAASGSLTLENATIGGEQSYDGTDLDKTKGNKAKDGGGIYAQAALTMKNCTVSYNTAETSGISSADGGGIYAIGNKLTMTVCTVKSNMAKTGGGIKKDNDEFTMTNCTLTNNVATANGGGIFTMGTCDFTMANCTLSGNTVNLENNESGGGVYMSGRKFTMKGASCITPSTGGDKNKKGKNDVYLAGDKMITVEGTLNPVGGIAARIIVSNGEYSTSTKVLTGDITAGASPNQNYTKFTVTPKGGKNWKINESGHLEPPSVTITGGSGAWQALKTAVGAAQDGDVITIDGEIKATNTTGNNGEITISKNLTIRGKTGSTSDILDANGNHASTPPSDVPSSPHRIFKITGTAQVHLENLTLQNGKDTTSAGTTGAGGGGIWMADTAHLTLTGVTIRNCTSKGPGGGLCMEHDGSTAGGTLTMKNSRVIDNTVKEDGAISTSSGGGICLPNFAYTAVIDTCEISRNTVDVSAKLTTAGAITVQACGLYTGNSSESKTHIKGHTIIDGNRYVKHTSKNTKVRGIGIWMQGGEVTIGESGKSDAESPLIQNHLVGNANSVEGTAIYLEGSAKVNWKSGQITNNGGPTKAIAAKSGATFNNTSDNTAN